MNHSQLKRFEPALRCVTRRGGSRQRYVIQKGLRYLVGRRGQKSEKVRCIILQRRLGCHVDRIGSVLPCSRNFKDFKVFLRKFQVKFITGKCL